MNTPDHPNHPNRRQILQAGAASVVALLSQGFATDIAQAATGTPTATVPVTPPATPPFTTHPPLGFTSVPAGEQDLLRIPPEYEYSLLYRWGDPTGIAGHMPAFRPDAGNSAQDQAQQAGMHHDGMHFFPLDADGKRALLVLNHEYTDETLLHTRGTESITPETTRKSLHAMGVSVIEIALGPQGWRQVLPSRYARRIHGNTPVRISGPAAGAPALRTALNPAGDAVQGTFANCAMGVTPWGTYLTCEENFSGYFGGPAGSGFKPDASQKRYGLAPGAPWVQWWRTDERFDLTRHPNEANRFGWVVEIDPMDPTATPIKRTALGRKKQESATCTLTRDARVAVYMGDDTRFEYIYKFVSHARVQPGGYAANKDLLDSGTLYAARFDAGGKGQWLELTHGQGSLTAQNGFASQAEVLIHSRLAAQAVGATPMDRPEWITVHPRTGQVYASLTNNTQRGDAGKPAADAANPRNRNAGGQIIRWSEAGSDAAATTFAWDHFVLAGDPAQPGSATRYPGDPGHPGQPEGQTDAFGAPDGLHFDSGGLLWIQTDMSGQLIGKGPYARLGNNAMLCADPATGGIKRFLSGPRGCEITGCVVTPDRRTLFVNIQHPGETSDDGGGTHSSAWPDGSTPGSARPRSATAVVRRRDGGIVGT